jgi:hypothetical protein
VRRCAHGVRGQPAAGVAPDLHTGLVDTNRNPERSNDEKEDARQRWRDQNRAERLRQVRDWYEDRSQRKKKSDECRRQLNGPRLELVHNQILIGGTKTRGEQDGMSSSLCGEVCGKSFTEKGRFRRSRPDDVALRERAKSR